MSLKDRILKLEAQQGVLVCQTCAKPQVILRGETAPQNCPDCGKTRFTIAVVSERSRELTLASLAGKLAVDRNSAQGQAVVKALVDCGAARLASQAEPHQDAPEKFPAPDSTIPQPEPEPDKKCTTPEPLPDVSKPSTPHPQDAIDDRRLEWWEKQF